MMRWTTRVLLAVLVLCLLYIPARADDKPVMTTADRLFTPNAPEALVQQASDATALLYAQDKEGTMRMMCTASAFERQPAKGDDKQSMYFFRVAGHCVASDDKDHERVKLENGNWFINFDEDGAKIFLPAAVVAVGYQQRGDDFAVLKVKTDKSVTLIPDAHGAVRMGEQVFNIASPLGLGKQLFRGHVSMTRLNRPMVSEDNDLNWKNYIMLQMSVGGGSSGSPVVSIEQGGVIGFVIGTISGGDSLNIAAVPVKKFTKFWEESKAGTYKWFKQEKEEDE